MMHVWQMLNNLVIDGVYHYIEVAKSDDPGFKLMLTIGSYDGVPDRFGFNTEQDIIDYLDVSEIVDSPPKDSE